MFGGHRSRRNKRAKILETYHWTEEHMDVTKEETDGLVEKGKGFKLRRYIDPEDGRRLFCSPIEKEVSTPRDGTSERNCIQ